MTNLRHFEAAETRPAETLHSLGVPQGVIDQVASAMASLSTQIVNTRSLAPAD